VSLYAELKRRGVLKVGGAYVVVAWIVVQVAGLAFPAFDAPAWVLRVFILMAMLGFPIAVVMAWVLEVTPDGLRHEPSPLGNKRMYAIAAGLGALALAWYFVGQPALRGGQVVAPAAAIAAPAAPPSTQVAAPLPSPKSIAVLPFADFSPGRDHGWFSDGLTDEILNALTRTPDLLVSARTSSFQYKDSKLSVPQIARELGVAHVLEGSVRSTPERIRVTAQLIRAADGFHVWSQTYDRDAADMIAIQEDLAKQIAIAMRTSMDPAALADMAQVGTRSVEAYQAYLRGAALEATGAAADYTPAYDFYEHARSLDPTFAAAHARAAQYWLTQLDTANTLSELTTLSTAERGRHFDERIALAIRAAPGKVERLGYEAMQAARDLRLQEAKALYRQFLVERPGDAAAITQVLDLATTTSDPELLAQTLETIWPLAQVRLDVAFAQLNYSYRASDKRLAAERALLLGQRWRDNADVLYQVHRTLLWDRRVEEAAAVLQRYRGLVAATDNTAIPMARQACAEGRRADAEALLEALPPSADPARWHLLMLLGRNAEANALLGEQEGEGNLYGVYGYLVYPQFDPTPFPSLMKVLDREKVRRPPPLAIPFACPPAKASP
jgi:TolB-like protein